MPAAKGDETTGIPLLEYKFLEGAVVTIDAATYQTAMVLQDLRDAGADYTLAVELNSGCRKRCTGTGTVLRGFGLREWEEDPKIVGLACTHALRHTDITDPQAINLREV